MGSEQYVASMGALKMRENFKQQQAKMKRDKRVETGMRYLGHGLGIAGKINGVRTASPSKQSNLLLSAVSAGLNAGGSMMRDSRMSHHQSPAAPASQQAPVYNSYYFSNDSFNNAQPDELNYAEAEYQDADENAEYDYEDPEEQQYLDQGENDDNEAYWQQEQQQMQ
ncbi:MAG: hypothetical protein Q9222_003138 [Ikaeria aurantiellina]